MQASSIKNSTIPTIPPQTESTLQNYLSKIQGSIRSSEQNITQWYIDNALHYKNSYIPRLQLVNRVSRLIEDNVSNQKYMNLLFLEELSIIQLVKQSFYLADIAYVLFRHTQKKLKNKQLGESVIAVVKSKVQDMLRRNDNTLIAFYNLREVQMFLEHKDRVQQSIYIVQPYERQHMESQAMLIFYQVFKPLFERKSLQNVYDCLYPMILWFVVIKDNQPEKQTFLVQLAKKIDFFPWAKKNLDNIILFTSLNWIMNLLSVKYLQQDAFSFQTLAPLLIKIKNFPIYELVTNWLATQKNSKNLPKKIQCIFRNSLNSGCTLFCFTLIKCISTQLKKEGNYETLFHIFDTFIRKEYLSVKLPNGSFVREYMGILMLYAIGFINRDRLDGQTQLDRLAQNLTQVVCKTNVRYDQCHSEIIKFFRIYENRFHFLSNTCKNLVSTLERIYRYHISIAEIHQEVANQMFRGYNANYNDDQIQSLQRSHRYAGLTNLGNTCYMNSFIQSLFMTKKFKTLAIRAQDQGIVPINHPAFQSLVNLFSALNSKTSENVTQIEPIQFKKQIPEPFKSSYQQHDSGQFGRMLLDHLTTELKDTGLAEKINRLFTHQLRTKIICRGCNTQREMKQNTFDFILNVEQNQNQSITVSELIKNYFKGYQLDGNNLLGCNKCNANRPAFVLKQPVQLAEHLIATISIFKYDNYKSSKIIKPLNFQFSLNFKNILPKMISQNQVYQLYAFILHIGTGVERGHYQCLARNLEQNPMVWYKFDDHYVTEQEINQIQDFHFGENQTPYILFYSNSNKTRKIILDK